MDIRRPAAALAAFAFLILTAGCEYFTREDNLREELAAAVSSEYTFYSSKPGLSSPDAEGKLKKSYAIGTTQEFPSSSDDFKALLSLADSSYEFIGWRYYRNPDSGSTTPPENVTLTGDSFVSRVTVTPQSAEFYAAWGVSYTVLHFRQNSARDGYESAGPETRKGIPGETTEAAEKNFAGFTARPFSQETISADGSTVVTIYYDRNPYTVRFDANGGEGTMAPQTVYYGSAARLSANAYRRTGYDFAGWALSSGSDMQYTDGAEYTSGSHDVTLFAVWTPRTYTVLLSAPDADAGAWTEQVQATYGKALPSLRDLPLRTGWSLSGFFPESGGAGAKYYGSDGTGSRAWDKDEDNVTLYAAWTPRTDTPYTVRHWKQPVSLSSAYADYDLSGTDRLTGTTEGTTQAQAKEYTGFNLVGNVQQETISADGSTAVDIYYDRLTYTVTFDANGGEGTMAPQHLAYGVPMALDSSGFRRTGWSFSGWAVTQNGGKAYDDGGTYAIGAADVTLYAVWRENVLGFSVELPSYGAGDELSVEVTEGSDGIVRVTFDLEAGAGATSDISFDDIPVSCITELTGLPSGKAGFAIDTAGLAAGTYDIYIEAVRTDGSIRSRDIKLLVR